MFRHLSALPTKPVGLRQCDVAFPQAQADEIRYRNGTLYVRSKSEWLQKKREEWVATRPPDTDATKRFLRPVNVLESSSVATWSNYHVVATSSGCLRWRDGQDVAAHVSRGAYVHSVAATGGRYLVGIRSDGTMSIVDAKTDRSGPMTANKMVELPGVSRWHIATCQTSWEPPRPVGGRCGAPRPRSTMVF
jgi:hypothetical protein